jgi:hypothetical protein
MARQPINVTSSNTLRIAISSPNHGSIQTDQPREWSPHALLIGRPSLVDRPECVKFHATVVGDGHARGGNENMGTAGGPISLSVAQIAAGSVGSVSGVWLGVATTASLWDSTGGWCRPPRPPVTQCS